MTQKLVLIDGHSLFHRAFYAIRELRTTSGVPTNAVYGFVNMLLKILAEEKPDYVAVAFDTAAPTFRHKEYEQYKATRDAMPDDLAQQVPIVKEVVSAFNIHMYELDGYEADDIIGTAARTAEQSGVQTVVVTGDRDMLQLVSDKTNVILTKRGMTDTVRYDTQQIAEQLGLSASQIPDYKALVGDASDNIPGVPGIGPKTATRLLAEFGNVESIIENSSRLSGKNASLIQQHTEQIRMSKMLATIAKDAPVGVCLEECAVSEPDKPRLGTLFRELEFRQLSERLGLADDESHQPQIESDSAALLQVTCVESLHDARLLLAELAKAGQLALYAECGRGRRVERLCVSNGDDSFVVSFGAAEDGFRDFARCASEVLADTAIAKYGHDIKPFLVALQRAGVRLRHLTFDSAVAGYLLDPSRSSYKLDDLCREYLGFEPRAETAFGWQAEVIWRLRKEMQDTLTEQGMASLFGDVEMPLVMVLSRMEAEGVCVDEKSLRDMSKEFETKIHSLEEQIYRLAGDTFNINSTKQLGEILFERLNLPVIKKTKTGYSTDAEVLEALAPHHEIAHLLLSYRQLVKLKGTYLDGLQHLIDDSTGRLHTTFNQTVTATGRLSSAEPNLQNIPIRQEAGRLIRKVFVPRHPKHLLLAADYSQIELRILAHISEDENMREAFRLGQDIHARTASEVFGVQISDVTPEMRRAAKAVNFGIVYGISDYGLSQNLGIPKEQAKTYIDNYFSRYPGVKRWTERVIEEAREKGYVTTMLGRRRYLPDLHSRNRAVRQFAERTAVNTPIQGSAADLIKLAMVKVDSQLETVGSECVMLLQVHDELIFEISQQELMLTAEVIKRTMAQAMEFSVPIVVDMKVGHNWCDMSSL